MTRTRALVLLVAITVALGLAASPAHAQDYPGTTVLAPAGLATAGPTPAVGRVVASAGSSGATGLPHTGAGHVDDLVKTAAALLAFGALAVAVSRRRPSSSSS